ncbi:BPSL1445 family SYLF domain-containing lipoprotein [Hyphomicrobium sp.]|jgi:lipid-binding SYLF domain-containing protein|uniref:BPSL1445 family SYLF domain-containing lipoprotein n=1 Tax=Hyphomicrobium sp. TaxID=82 RepID=UPI002FE1BF17
MSSKTLLLNALLAFALLLGAPSTAGAGSAYEIDADVDAALQRFYRTVPGARGLVRDAAAVLVFPSVVKAGMGFGGEYGEGALRRRGYTEGYYNTVSASVGFQLGVQARTVIILFMTENALASFQRKHGWKVGVDGSVALVTVGVGGSIDTNQIKKPVIGFILNQKGLMYNLTLEGSKISRIDR